MSVNNGNALQNNKTVTTRLSEWNALFAEDLEIQGSWATLLMQIALSIQHVGTLSLQVK